MTDTAHGSLPGPIGERFGAFEPRFYGVSFVLETPATFQAWLAHSGVFPEFTGPTLASFEMVCLRSAIEHETRHFHDALISPFANALFRWRMMATFNGLKVFNRAIGTTANCLPIPAKAWMAMNQAQRETWLSNVTTDLPASLSAPVIPLSLPYLDRDPLNGMTAGLVEVNDDPERELEAFAKATVWAYDRAAELMRGPVTFLRTNPVFDRYPEEQKRAIEATMTPRNVFEVSALAVQLQALWTNVGEAAMHELGRHLMTSDAGSAQVFRRIAARTAPVDQRGMIDPTRISAVATWCLLGDAQERSHLDPMLRLERVLKVLADAGGIANRESIATLWDEWDAATSMKSWRTCVTEMRAGTAKSYQSYRTAAAQPGESHAIPITAILEAYSADQAAATDLLLDNPNAYVDTRVYVESSTDALPQPFLSVELGDFVAPVKTFPVSDAFRLLRVFDRDGVRGWNRCVVDLHNPPRPALLDAALQYEFNCKLCDLAFSDEAIDPVDKETLLTSLGQASGLTPLFVF